MLDPTRTLYAEFATPEHAVGAARLLRERGLRRMEAYTPYPVQALEDELQLPRSRIPTLVFAFGLLGAGFAYALQYLLVARDYPLVVGALPPHAGPAFIPITFETTVLFASLAAFLGFFAMTKLPRLWHPLFEVPGIESATISHFWLQLTLDAGDADVDECVATLRHAGALRVVSMPEGSS